MLTPIPIDKRSPFLGEECALCKDPFAPGEEIILCPEDNSRHHDRCWIANGCKCAAYGCRGQGSIGPETVPETVPDANHPLPNPTPGHNAGRFGCGQTCLLIGIAIAIIFFSIGCFGLWAIADYLMLNVWDMPYRAPFSAPVPTGLILPYFLFGL